MSEIIQDEFTIYRNDLDDIIDFAPTYVDNRRLYDFLFDNDYDATFCNQIRGLQMCLTEDLKDLIMGLHTGETLRSSNPNWAQDHCEKIGQQYLRDLAEDVLKLFYSTEKLHHPDFATQANAVTELRNRLEIDGYVFNYKRLLEPEEDVVDTAEETGVLSDLFSSLMLDNSSTAFHHLKLSEEHYLADKWDDSISNSRKFFECVMQEVAAKHSLQIHQRDLGTSIYSRPAAVRDYLENEGLLEPREKSTIASVYGLLSHTGGHPYMAQSDQARLLRHLALTLSQFLMLRFKGSSTTPLVP